MMQQSMYEAQAKRPIPDGGGGAPIMEATAGFWSANLTKIAARLHKAVPPPDPPFPSLNNTHPDAHPMGILSCADYEEALTIMEIGFQTALWNTENMFFHDHRLMAVFAYALSVVGRRWRRGFSEKPLTWLSALEKRSTVGRWILVSLGLSRHAYHLVAATSGHGFSCSHRYNRRDCKPFRELSGYARLEIEVRKRLSTR